MNSGLAKDYLKQQGASNRYRWMRDEYRSPPNGRNEDNIVIRID
jgi:hypothetical protein